MRRDGTRGLGRALAYVEGNAERICRAVIGMLLLGGLGYSIYLGENLRYPDERDYLGIADSVCEAGVYSRDGGVTPTAYRAPGYPLFLAASRCLGAPIVWLRFLGFVALAGAAWFAGRAVEASRGRGARVLLTAATAFYPLHVYAASTLYPQVIAMCGFCLLLERVAHTQQTGGVSAGSSALLGVAGTLVVLSVPPMLPAVAIAWFAVWTSARSGRLRLLVVAGAVALSVGAWSARNWNALGEPVLLSTNSGYNLAVGNSPKTLASSGLSVDIDEWRAAARGLPEVERDRSFRNAALDWIRAEPAAAAALYVRKLGYFFAASNQMATAEEGTRARDVLMYATYGPAALLALLSLCLAAFGRRPLSRVEATAALALLATAGVYAVFFARLRFRVPVEPAVLMLAATYLAERIFGVAPAGRKRVDSV